LLAEQTLLLESQMERTAIEKHWIDPQGERICRLRNW